DEILRAFDDVEGDGEIAAGMGDDRVHLNAAVAGGLVEAGDVVHAGAQQGLAEAAVAEDAFGRDGDLRKEILAREELVAAELDFLDIVARPLGDGVGDGLRGGRHGGRRGGGRRGGGGGGGEAGAGAGLLAVGSGRGGGGGDDGVEVALGGEIVGEVLLAFLDQLGIDTAFEVDGDEVVASPGPEMGAFDGELDDGAGIHGEGDVGAVGDAVVSGAGQFHL